MDDKGKYRFYPDHVATEAIMGLLLLFLITVFTIVFPPGLGQKASPVVTPEHIKPEWYFFPMYFWMKLVPMAIGVLVPVLVAIAFVLWPFLDGLFQKWAPGRELSAILGAIGVAVMCLFLVLGALS